MDKEQTLEVIKCASKFMAKGDVRHYLNGLCLEFQHNSVIVTGTDGHRLFNATISGEHEIPVNREYIIAGENIAKILKLYDHKKDEAKELHFHLEPGKYSKEQLRITDGCISYDMEPVGDKFPDWRRTIPTFGGKDAKTNTFIEFGMNLKYVAEACTALQPLSNQAYKGARFRMADANTSCLIEVTSPEYTDLTDVRAVIMPMRL